MGAGTCHVYPHVLESFTPPHHALTLLLSFGTQGKPSPLLSSFRLSYYTMLNMLRRLEGGDASMEYVIRHSFQQFQQERQLPQVGARMRLHGVCASGLRAGVRSSRRGSCYEGSWKRRGSCSQCLGEMAEPLLYCFYCFAHILLLPCQPQLRSRPSSKQLSLRWPSWAPRARRQYSSTGS